MVFPFELIGGGRIAQTTAFLPVADCLPGGSVEKAAAVSLDLHTMGEASNSRLGSGTAAARAADDRFVTE